MDDPVLVEAEEDDFWFRGFNMRTGERGVFPAFYAHAVPGPAKDLLGEAPSLRVIVSPSTPPVAAIYPTRAVLLLPCQSQPQAHCHTLQGYFYHGSR